MKRSCAKHAPQSPPWRICTTSLTRALRDARTARVGSRARERTQRKLGIQILIRRRCKSLHRALRPTATTPLGRPPLRILLTSSDRHDGCAASLIFVGTDFEHPIALDVTANRMRVDARLTLQTRVRPAVQFLESHAIADFIWSVGISHRSITGLRRELSLRKSSIQQSMERAWRDSDLSREWVLRTCMHQEAACFRRAVPILCARDQSFGLPSSYPPRRGGSLETSPHRDCSSPRPICARDFYSWRPKNGYRNRQVVQSDQRFWIH
jgi:hypothetical protein